MKITIIGQKWLGEQVLRACLGYGYDVQGDSISPTGDRSAAGYDIRQVIAPANDRLATLAQNIGIHITVMNSRVTTSDIIETPDIIIAANWHAYITQGVIDTPTVGVLGYHPSLLPLHRGRDAVRWAIHMRERVTGATVYWYNNKVDGGDIAAQGFCFIRPTDTPTTLWRRELAPMGVRLIMNTLSGVDSGIIKRLPQDESLATWEPAFSRAGLAA